MYSSPISTDIQQIIEAIPGWTPLDQLLVLYTLAVSTACLDGDVLEIGSWCGRSSVVLGMATRASGIGKLHCVDVFPERDEWFENPDGTYSFSALREGEICLGHHTQTVWAEPFQRDVAPTYERFVSIRNAFENNIKEHKLQNYINIHAMSSQSFARKVADKVRIRLAFIDGGHSYEEVAHDIHLVEDILIPGGWICFDDAFASYVGVDEAIRKYIIESSKFESWAQITRKLFIARRK